MIYAVTALVASWVFFVHLWVFREAQRRGPWAWSALVMQTDQDGVSYRIVHGEEPTEPTAWEVVHSFNGEQDDAVLLVVHSAVWKLQ